MLARYWSLSCILSELVFSFIEYITRQTDQNAYTDLHGIYLSAPCLDPGEPGNGIRIGNDSKHGKSIEFICDDDFERVGKKTIQCLDGKWSHKIPQCKGKRCIR